MIKTPYVSNGGYINTHCFNGGWDPRVLSSNHPFLDASVDKGNAGNHLGCKHKPI